MPTGQQYATNVPQTTLTSQVNATTTTFPVASSTSWPTPPFTAVVDIGLSTQEPVDVTNIVGTTWTVTRNIDGTTGFAHANGATVTHADIGRDFREARSHIDSAGPQDASSEAVHGLTNTAGNVVVGTKETQTLANKTLTTPAITGAAPVTGSVNTGLMSITNSTTVTGVANADLLITESSTSNALGIQTSGDTNNRFQISNAGIIKWGPGNAAVDLTMQRQSGPNLALIGGSLDIFTPGAGLKVSEGSNAKQGTAALSSGSVVVSNTSVTSNSRIFLTTQSPSGTPGAVYVSARTAGTSFTITSTSGTDNSTVAFEIIEPG